MPHFASAVLVSDNQTGSPSTFWRHEGVCKTSVVNEHFVLAAPGPYYG